MTEAGGVHGGMKFCTFVQISCLMQYAMQWLTWLERWFQKGYLSYLLRSVLTYYMQVLHDKMTMTFYAHVSLVFHSLWTMLHETLSLLLYTIDILQSSVIFRLSVASLMVSSEYGYYECVGCNTRTHFCEVKSSKYWTLIAFCVVGCIVS